MIDKETTELVDRRSAVVARYSHRVGDERADAAIWLNVWQLVVREGNRATCRERTPWIESSAVASGK